MAMHYGVYFDDSEPTTGVVQSNRVEWLSDEEMAGINLSYEEAEQEFRAEFAREHGIEVDEVEEHDDWDEEVMNWNDGYYGDSETYLIGSWKKDEDGHGQYVPDPDAEGAEYAAIVREFVVQVLWSKRVVRVRSMCSPCYPGQADLDSGEEEDGILAYALPLEVMGKEYI